MEQELMEQMEALKEMMQLLNLKLDSVEDKLQQRMGELHERQEKGRKAFERDMLEEFAKQNETLDRRMSEVEHNLKVYMESAVGRRMEVLFEGYSIQRDRSGVLEQGERDLQRQIDEIQVRLAVLEADKHSA